MESKLLLFNNEDILVYSKNKLAIIYNKKTKVYMRLSKEVYNYFEIAVKNKLTEAEFIDNFFDESDKKYICEVIKIMKKNYILKNGELDSLRKNYFDVYLCITNRCNLNCEHCCSESNILKNEDLINEDIKKIIDVLSELAVSNIVITGGEPMIRKDFFDIITYIKRVIPNSKLILSTNATLINKDNIDFIVSNFDKIDISIDGIDEETCSEIRGKGVFKKVIESIELIKRKKFNNIYLSIVISMKNINLLRDFRILNKKLGTMPVERFFVPTGRGLENRKKFLESDSVLPIIIPKLLGEYCKESLHGRKQSENFNGLNKISACSCDAGIKKFFINYNADIYPCQSLIKEEYRIGNVFDNDIKYKLLNFENTCCGKKIEMIQPYNLKHCKNCDVNIFCWNCPAMIDSVKENEIEIKNWCELMKEKLNHLVWKI